MVNTPKPCGTPVTREQHDEVLEWLKGDRVLGHHRKLWASLLDES